MLLFVRLDPILRGKKHYSISEYLTILQGEKGPFFYDMFIIASNWVLTTYIAVANSNARTAIQIFFFLLSDYLKTNSWDKINKSHMHKYFLCWNDDDSYILMNELVTAI